MNLFSRLPHSFRSLFQHSPKTVTRRRPARVRLGRADLELEERSVPAIISSQLPNGGGVGAGGATSGTAPRSTISGFVFCDDNGNGVQDRGEHGIADVTIRLVRNGAVVARTETDASGLYFFGNLPAGNYRVVEVQPPDVEQGEAILGTINGETRGRVIDANRMAFFLPRGSNAVDYNFSEICLLPPGGGNSPTNEEPPPTRTEESDCPIPVEDPAAFTVTGSVVTLTGTSNGDVFSIVQAGSQVTVTFTSVDATGAVTTRARTFNAGEITTVNVNGQFGNDWLVIDNGGGLLGITVNYNGGYGTDTLRLRNGVAETQVYTAGQAEDEGSVTLTGAGGVAQTVNYEDIGLIADTVVAANMTIVGNNFQQPISVLNGQTWGEAVTTRVTGIHRDKKVEICHHTGSATNPGVYLDIARPALKAHQAHGDEVVSDEPPAIPIEFANKTNVSVIGGNGSDFFLFNNPATATGLQNLTLDGGNGKDVVNIQAEPADPNVDVILVNIEERSGNNTGDA